MSDSIFITGIGTGVGKTLVAAIVAEALHADYWKPIQAGFSEGTDAQLVQSLISNTKTKIYPELYKLRMSASPHIAAKAERILISTDKILAQHCQLSTANCQLIIEGVGGLMVPLNENEFVFDLIKKLSAKIILVSRNYLGSINHSLLTAAVCKQHNLNVCGWIFNDDYLSYEDEIVQWSGYKKIASIPYTEKPDKQFVHQQAAIIKQNLLKMI